MKYNIKNIRHIFSRYILQTVGAFDGALKYLHKATLHWLAVLLVWFVATVILAFLSVWLVKEVEIDEDDKKSAPLAVLNMAKLNKVLRSYEGRAERLETLKRGATRAIDPSL